NGVARLVPWPSRLVPADALSTVPDGLAAFAIPQGAVVTASHLTSGGHVPSLRPGMASVPLPLELVAAVEVGTTVDVVVAAADTAGVVAATDARVVAVDDDHVWVAVERAEAATVAAASMYGYVVLVTVGG